uniref:Uncharacterized protein n=1 Tax=Ciona savignyi TaxID=51511 RepID=H2ZDE6_CIOSA
MGCNFSKRPVKVVTLGSIENSEENNTDTKRNSFTKSDESTICPSSLSENYEIEQNKFQSSHIFVAHRSKSVDLSKNGSVHHDDPPVAMATIIRGASISKMSENNGDQINNVLLPNQTDCATVCANEQQNRNNIIASQRALGFRRNVNHRRVSAGELKNSPSLKTCVAHPVMRRTSEPNLDSSFAKPTLPEIKQKFIPFGPRNSKLTLTQSQKDFFRMLDEKIAQGRDYCSEDDHSLASLKSFHEQRNSSAGSHAISIRSR